jgi:hypothetical protein
MKVKGPVACLLATLISVLATVTVAADTDTDSSATAAHGLRVSKAKEENRALEDLSHSQLRTEYTALKVEAKAAALAVEMKKVEVKRAKFLLHTETVWEECPRFGPTSEHSCDPITLTSKCPFYGKMAGAYTLGTANVMRRVNFPACSRRGLVSRANHLRKKNVRHCSTATWRETVAFLWILMGLPFAISQWV